MLRFLLSAALLAALPCSLLAADDEETEVPAVLNFQMTTLDGEEAKLSDYSGKVVMIVNVASRCGATPQYEPLQALYEKYRDQGFVILGFPCNQFGAQEPGSAEQIREFCSENYGVTFPMFSKIDVNGDGATPLYQYLTSAETNPEHAGEVGWNFEKFLIGRDGEIVGRFRTRTQPDAPEVVEAIEAQLATDE